MAPRSARSWVRHLPTAPLGFIHQQLLFGAMTDPGIRDDLIAAGIGGPGDLYDSAYDDVELPPELGDELREQIVALTEFKTELDRIAHSRE